MADELQHLLSQADIKLSLPLDYRLKSWESALPELERHGFTPSGLRSVNDLAGVRAVLVFRRDVERVCDIISDTFKVIKREDTSKRLGDREFGYGSIHYVVEPPSAWLEVPTMADLGGLRAEIQVRTGAQHIWASASHVLQYKREEDVPRSLRRAINRIAAVLEIVDNEFERVRAEREDYVDEASSDGGRGRSLNAETLRLFLRERFDAGRELLESDLSVLLEDLRHFEIESVEDLADVWRRQSDSVLEIDRERQQKEGQVFSQTGLVRMALKEETGHRINHPLSGAPRYRHRR